jgi:hypothetical protein
MPELHLLPAQPGVFFREEDHKYFYIKHDPGNDLVIQVPSSSHIIALGGGKDFDKTPWRKSLMRKGLNERGAEYFMDHMRDIRAAIGTEAHALIERELNPSVAIAGKVCQEATAVHELWLEHVLPRIGKVYVIEKPAIHPGGCYGFTPDLVAEVDGILSLCDWKSNQAEHFAERYQRLVDYAPDDDMMRGICEHLAAVDAEAGKVKEATARVRDGWQMQQGSYGFGLEAVHGLRVQRGINFMLSVDGVKEQHWNRPDLDQGWKQFAGGLLLHHQRAVMAGGHPVFQAALNALYPLMHA